MRRRNIGTYAPLVVMLAALLPFLALLLDSDAVLLFRDLTNVYIPAKAIWVRGVFALGRIPLWDSLHSGGRPFLPDLNAGPLYPLNLIFLPFGPENVARGAAYFIAAHHALMALGAYFLFRRLRCRAEVSAAGALAFAWSGYCLGVDTLFMEIGGAVALPFFIFFLLGARGTRLLSPALVLASLALAWALYSGNAEMLYVAFFLAPLVLWKHSFARALAQTFVLGLLTALAAAPQLAPTISYLSQTSREFESLAPELHTHFQNAWSLHPLRLFELIFPYAFGPPGTTTWGSSTVTATGTRMPFVLGLHCGAALALPLILLFPAVLRRARKWEARSKALAVAWALLWLLALGDYSPIPIYKAAVEYLPVWNRFRYPERLAIWPCMFWITACTLALERVVRLRLRPRAYVQAAGAFGMIAVIFFARFKAWEGVIHAGAFFAAAIVALSIPKIRSNGFLVISLLDLLLVSRSLVWPQSSSLVNPNDLPLVAKIAHDLNRPENAAGVGSARREFTLDLVRGFAETEGVSALDSETARKWSNLVYNTTAYSGIESATGFFALKIGQTLADRMSSSTASLRRALDLMSVRYLLTIAPEGTSLNVSRSAVPFASLPQRIVWVANPVDAFAKISDPAWNYEGSAVIEGPPALAREEWGWRIKNVAKNFDQIKVEVEAAPAAGRWLLISESYSPHWLARGTGGRSLAVHKANAWAMAVGLPVPSPGSMETIVLEYGEPSFQFGLACFGLWILLALIVWAQRLPLPRKSAKIAE